MSRSNAEIRFNYLRVENLNSAINLELGAMCLIYIHNLIFHFCVRDLQDC